MESEKPVILIIGIDSFIGNAMKGFLQSIGEPYIGTTRRSEMTDSTHFFLDLSKNHEYLNITNSVSVAIICAGITKLDYCKHNPDESFQINVNGAVYLVKKLLEKGIFVIYLSTNQVFDGNIPYRLADDPMSPITEYGRQKAEAERLITEQDGYIAIIRLTKVLGTENLLFSNWSKALKEGNSIRPFSDMVISPIPISCVVTVLYLVAKLRLSGITQLSGDRDISYAEVAFIAAKILGAKSNLIQPVEALKAKPCPESIQKHTTLNVNRLRSVFGIEPPDVKWTIEKVFQTYKNNL